MPIRASDLLTLTREGLYCPLGRFHVDPTWPVERALITHGHADHARSGHGHVLATPETLRIMAVRYGADFCRQRQEAKLGESIRIGEVTVRFAPDPAGCRVTFEHGGWHAGNAADRGRFGDWPALLARYAALVSG